MAALTSEWAAILGIAGAAVMIGILVFVFRVASSFLDMILGPDDEEDEQYTNYLVDDAVRGGAFTFLCEACGRRRPDNQIDVHQKRISGDDGFQMTRNVNFCRNNRECYHRAVEIADEYAERMKR